MTEEAMNSAMLDDADVDLGGGRAAQRARTNARIIAAATELLNGEDDAAFTARNVAERAGVSPGLVLQRFESLADLALEVFLSLNAEFATALNKAAARHEAPEDKVLAAFSLLLERDLARRSLTGRVMAFAWTWTRRHEERLHETVEAIADTIGPMLEDPARPTTPVARRAAAGALLTIYNGFLRLAVVDGEDVEACVARMHTSFGLVLGGLYAGSA